MPSLPGRRGTRIRCHPAIRQPHRAAAFGPHHFGIDDAATLAEVSMPKHHLDWPFRRIDVHCGQSERALPGVDIDTVPMTRVPGRAKWRSPLLWWTYRAGADEAIVSVRSGLLTKAHAVMRHEKIQSVRLSVGPWQ